MPCPFYSHRYVNSLEHQHGRSLAGFVKKSKAGGPTKQLKPITKVAKEGSTCFLYCFRTPLICGSLRLTLFLFFILNQRKKKNFKKHKKGLPIIMANVISNPTVKHYFRVIFTPNLLQ